MRQASDEGFSRAIVIKALVPGKPSLLRGQRQAVWTEEEEDRDETTLSVSPDEGL
jgi:hypothetical protein